MKPDLPGPQRKASRSRFAKLPAIRAHMVALLLGIAITAAFAAVRVVDSYELRLARELVFDEFQRIAPRPARATKVRIVDIDEASLVRLGQWPWPRSDLARLVERLNGLGAAAIVFDMVFPEPDRLSPSSLVRQDDFRNAIGPDIAGLLAARLPNNDDRFRDSLAGKPVVLGYALTPDENPNRPAVKPGLAFTGADPRTALPSFGAATVNLPALDAVAKGIGAITVSPLDVQGVIRRIPLLWSDGKRIYPSLLIEALRVAAGETTVLAHSRDAAPFAATAVSVAGFELPTTAAGELRIWFRHEDPQQWLSAARLLTGEDDSKLRELVEDHIVLIGTSAVGLFDRRVTPLAETVPGVSIHAQALEQVLTGDHLVRPDWVEPFECLWILILGLFVTLTAVFCSPMAALAYGGIAAAVTVSGAGMAFLFGGLLLDPVFPSIAGLALYVTLISFRYFVSDRERRFVRQAFARYVAPSYLAEIERDPSSLRLGGDEREVTVLFLDIRDFTAISEQLTPREVVDFLNRLFGRLSADILAEGGTIDKYIGDSLMAFWNAPIHMEDHAARACRAALRMRESLRDLNDQDAFHFRRKPIPLADVGTRIGINTGLAMVGNMGSEMRFNYSVVGDAVNVASRIEGQCKPLSYDIVVSESVAAAAPKFALLAAGTIDLRGKLGQEDAFVLVGDEAVAATRKFAGLRRAHEALVGALRAQSTEWQSRLFECFTLTTGDFPDLKAFYSRIAGRVQDFSPDPARSRPASALPRPDGGTITTLRPRSSPLP